MVNKMDGRKRRRQRQQEYKEKLAKKLKSVNANNYDPKVVINSEAISSTAGSDHRVKQIPFPSTLR